MKNKYLKTISIIITALLLITCMTVMSKADEENNPDVIRFESNNQDPEADPDMPDVGTNLDNYRDPEDPDMGMSYDDDEDEEDEEGENATEGNEATKAEDKFLSDSLIGNAIDGIVGILLTPLKIFIVIAGTIIRAISGGIALIGGYSSLGDLADTVMLSPEDIIFNEINLTNIDIFDFSVSGPILTIRENIAKWYYGLRVLAVVILLIIFIYVGLRMALSTVAEEEAKYKKMLKDWLVSFILVFLLHYIIIFTISINNGLVDVFSQSLENTTNFGTAVSDVLIRSLHFTLSIGLGSAIVYLLLCALTLIFLVMYIKRMLTVAFLVIIAPIITITYSIDKMGDGKSQALNTWLKEFVYNVLIQAFHCIIYLVFGVTAVGLMDSTLASSVLAIIMIIFILQAEKIIKNIFGFNAGSMAGGLASAAAVGAGALAISKSFGKDKKKDAKAAGSAGGQSSGGASSGMPPKMKDGVAAAGGGTSGAPSSGASGGSGGTSGATSGGTSGGSGGTSSGAGGVSPYSSPSRAGKLAGLAANKGGKALKKYAKSIGGGQLKAASMMALAAFGAVTGDTGTTLALGAAGGSLYNVGKDKVNDIKMNKRVNENEKYFAGAYKDYARETGLSEDELRDKTVQIMEMDPEDIAEEDRAYAGYVYAMRDTYACAGGEDPRNRVLDTINKINSGAVQPKQNYG